MTTRLTNEQLRDSRFMWNGYGNLSHTDRARLNRLEEGDALKLAKQHLKDAVAPDMAKQFFDGMDLKDAGAIEKVATVAWVSLVTVAVEAGQAVVAFPRSGYDLVVAASHAHTATREEAAAAAEATF